MSKTPGDSDVGAAVPGAFETSAPTSSLADLSVSVVEPDAENEEVLVDAGRSFIEESDLLARETAAARQAGDDRRADALLCAQAFRATARGQDDEALSLWRAAFDRDASLLAAFWGVRVALTGRGAWQDLLGVLDRRIRALGPARVREPSPVGDASARLAGTAAPEEEDSFDQAAREQARADLWLSHGRLLEDRLGRDEEASRSYRAGLIERPRHPGLLLALLLLGWRRGDPATALEALAGLLRLRLRPRARALITAAVARIERSGAGGDSASAARAGTGAASVSLGGDAAARALESLRGGLQAVGSADAGPLVQELITVARSTADPPVLAEILGELVRHLSSERSGGSSGPSTAPDLAVSLLRSRARLLREGAGDPSAARDALRQALGLAPGHPLVLVELADLADRLEDEAVTAGRSPKGAEGLADLLAVVAPGDAALPAEAERELGLRHAMALGRRGRAGAGLAFLRQHPELVAGARPDVEALIIALSAMAGDVVGLAATFDSVGDRQGAAAAAGGANALAATDRAGAAHAHLVAGALRERAATPAGDPMGSYEQALALAPGSEIAAEAIERRLRETASWSALAARWEARLAGEGSLAPDPATRRRLLEELVALHRDSLRDAASARRFQDQLMGPGAARALLRRLHLELAIAGALPTSDGDGEAGLLRALGEAAGTAGLQTALHVEAGRAYADRGATRDAEQILRPTLSTDTTGLAGSTLERLPAVTADRRAEIVRAELARLADESPTARRSRALRFRLAHHLAAAGRAPEAVEALEPLRAAGDETADALVWEIARRSGNADLEAAVLEATTERGPDDPGGLTDLGEAYERAGDLAGAAEAYRRALAVWPGADAALGLFRTGALTGDADMVVEASRALSPFADDGARIQLDRDREMLSILGAGRTLGGAGPATDLMSLVSPASSAAGGAGPVEDEAVGVLGWARGVESGDALSVSAGLLALARSMPAMPSGKGRAASGDRGGLGAQRGEATDDDRDGLLVRAATRARLGGAQLSGAVHDQAWVLSTGSEALGVGLSDLPVAGRPERAEARVARAARSGGRLGYALLVEVGVDAEAHRDASGALAAFVSAAAIDPSGIEALDGIRRVALASGDLRAAAQAGMRLGLVLRSPTRAAIELRRAAVLWRQLGMAAEAKVAYFQALAREPRSAEAFTALHGLLHDPGDDEDLERLLTLRLAVVSTPAARLPLLLERGLLRHDRLGNQDAAIDDFKRILKIDPTERRALRELATLAAERECHPQAIAYLERLLAIEGAPAARAALLLELAEAHEAARDPSLALDILRDVIARMPSDLSARQRLVEVQLRAGDWAAAVVALRAWEAVLDDPVPRAALWLRIGDLQRDHEQDRRAAEDAYGRAAALHPLGDAIFRLVDLHRAADDPDAERAVVSAAIADLRRALAADPLDMARLERLGELCGMLAHGPDGDPAAALALTTVSQLLQLLGEPIEATPATRPTFSDGVAPNFWSRLEAPGVTGLPTAIWRRVARAAGGLFPPDDLRLPPRDKIGAAEEPRLAWIETAAAALGIPELKLALARGPDPTDTTVMIIEGNDPALLVGRGALAAGAPIRFHVGRALGLLHAQGAALERLQPAQIDRVFEAAALAGGAPRRDPGAPSEQAAQRAKQLARSMSRKELKALELDASRSDFETIDATAFRSAVLQTADRTGLLFAGDLAVAVRIICSASGALDQQILAADPRALHLVRFALSEEYLALRLESRPGEI